MVRSLSTTGIGCHYPIDMMFYLYYPTSDSYEGWVMIVPGLYDITIPVPTTAFDTSVVLLSNFVNSMETVLCA